jgi:hypothetical protein
VGNAAAAGVKRRRLTAARARQLIKDFEQVTLQELAIDHIDQPGRKMLAIKRTPSRIETGTSWSNLIPPSIRVDFVQ